MAVPLNLNPAYEAIGKGFVQQYYLLFDDPAQRPNLVNMYNAETSFMTFEGMQLQGAMKIMEKLNSLTFQKINRIITAVDSQPMFDGGVLINVLGRLQTDEDPPHAYSQTFVLKPIGTSFYVQHDLFRLALHDSL
ncbi:probable nuclear transport factor 2 isoform X1 [Homalodisca vitripennis]|uniref:NTF2-related export protein n=1 Tax=Homalodisca liturata TaxID=320908 RepID=A0A1B6HHC0_9HEMI|nr:probable nuclear transport factor 2 isoform X1 [Homalodisca vitripennis]